MDSFTPRKNWKKISLLTQQMLDLSKSELWDELESLERERDVLIKNYFLSVVDESQSEFIAKGINEVLRIDKEIVKICQAQKDQVGEKLEQFNTSRRAKNAYQQCSP